MKLLPTDVGLVLLPLLLAGCAATSVPASTATVTVTASPSPSATLLAGDAAPWDLHAVCATEAGISTLEQWRDHQTRASHLSSREAAAITQGIAVQYLEMSEFTTASPVQQQVDALARAAGTLDHPKINLDSTAVRTARTGIANTCRENGLTIGIYAQGG
jgi:hypothetical protein